MGVFEATPRAAHSCGSFHDQCALERELATGEPGNCQPSDVVDKVQVGCFSDFHAVLSGNMPDQVITL